jgi:hypothetical protein
LAQPLVTNKGESRPLTLSEIRGITNKSVVGTFEILTENGWQPLFLKKGQSLGINALNNDVLTTTELSEALAISYSFTDNTLIEKESPYLYVTMPNRQVSDNVRDSLEKGEPFFFSLVSGGGGWSGDYVSLDKRGFKLEDIYIETEPLSPLRGRPVLFRNGQTEFLHLGTLKTSDVFFQDIKSLLEHTFDSKEEIVSAINYIESVVGVADFSREGDYLDVESDLSTKVEITARTVQFTPIETTKGFRIQSTVNRISTKEGFIHIPFDNRESEIGWSEKIQAGILAERIHVPKDEENQVTVKGLLRVFVKDNKVQTESVPLKDYQSFLLDRIRTRLIKIGDTGVLAERYLWAKENKFPINESKVTPSRQSLPDVVEESQIPTPEKSIKSNKYEKDEEVFFQTVKDENTLPDVSDRDAALQWMSRVMPDAPMEIVEGLIDGIGRGSFDSLKDLITLSRQYADGKTVYHEVFHRAFAMLPDETREKLLDEGSKRFSIERGESKATIKYSAKQQDQINYTLKAVDILNSDKAKQVFDKGVKNNWTLDKILTELAIPKEQKQLILDLQKKEVNSNPIKLGVKELFNENSEFANQVYETLGFKQNKIDLKPYALDVWGKVPNQRGDNKFVDKEQYSVKINTENKGIDVRLTIYFDKDTNTAFVSNIENFENEVTHKDKKGLGKKAFIEANKLIVSRGFTPVIDNLVSGFGYDMLSKLEKEGFLVKNLDKIKGESNYKNIKYKESPFSFTDKIYQDQITPQQKQQALQLYSQYLDTIFPDSKVKDIVYHFSNVKIDKPDKEKFSLSANINRRKGFFGISKNINPGNNFANVEGTIPHAMLFDMKNPDFGDFSIIPPIVAKDDSKDSAIIKQRGDVNYYSVFEPEQIHILGNKSDIEGFKKFRIYKRRFL